MAARSYPDRKQQRLAGYDYASAGFYFVTVCIQNRLPLLGRIVSGRMDRSPAGDLVARCWEEAGERYPGVGIDTLMVMPDHCHAIVSLAGDGASLSDVIHHVKARSTAQYALRVRDSGWAPFPSTLWQKGFYDHVIRSEKELNEKREYSLQNPLRWSLVHEQDGGPG
jgi:REP element-mobilizing transposase RayT